MSDYRRSRIPGGTYFFTVVTFKRIPFFNETSNVDHLRDAVRSVKSVRPFDIDAFVVLPDHIHCIWRLPEGDADYPGRWREIKKKASRLIAPESDSKRERRLWQRRFWEHRIRDDRDWRRHMDYIHYNPVKHGYVNSPRDWLWSSFARCVDLGWYDDEWGQTEPVEIAGMELE